MKRISALFNRSLPFLTAATPGGFRIFVLAFSGFFMAREDMIYFSTEYTLASFFVMMSGIGFATILIKSMAENDSFSLFLRYAFSSALIGGLLAFICLLLISYVVPVPDFCSVFFLVLITSVYQVFRNYLVFKRSFFALLANDVLVGAVFVLSVLFVFFSAGDLEVSSVINLLSISYVSAFLLMLIFMALTKRVSLKGGLGLISKKNAASSLVVGLSNSASSGVSFILPSLFVSLGGSNIAIVASLAAAVFSAMSALPRGMINNNAASLSRMVMACQYSKELVCNLRSKINKLVFFLVPLLSLFMISYFYVIGSVNEFLIVIFFVAAFGFNVASGQLGVVESVLINFCGYERLSLFFNTAVFGFVMALFLVVKFVSFAQELLFMVYMIPILLGVINIMRMYWYRGLVKRFFGETYHAC